MIPERKLSYGTSQASPLRTDSYNTYSPSLRTKSVEDSELYIAGQGLVPVVNNPALHSSGSGSFGILSWPTSAADKAWTEATVHPMPNCKKDVAHSDFADYLHRLGTPVNKYFSRRTSIKQEAARKRSLSDQDGCGYLRGEGLVQALSQVPSMFFQEDFSLTRPDTFAQVIREETPEERHKMLERLNGYLDIVETELLNEIAARSASFFEAAESLQDLQKSMGDTLFQIQRLQVHAHNLDGGMCARAGQIQKLSRQRSNLEETLKLLQIVESATHAQETVNLLLLAHDYPSCLQLIDDLRQQYDNKSEDGLGSEKIKRIFCLRHIPDALDTSVVSLNSCLVGELLEVLNWDEAEGILRSVAAKALGEESKIGTTNTKEPSSIDYKGKKEKLKQIFIGLSRTGSLSGTFVQVIPHIVSKLISSVRNLSEILLPNFVHIATNDESIQDLGVNAHLHHITPEMFLALLDACLSVEESCIWHYAQLGDVITEAVDDPSLIHHASMVERGKNDLCQALVEASQAHWMELFAVRAQIHHKLTLHQIQALKEKTQRCSDLAKKAHVRSSQKLETLLQAQCKSAITNIHHQSFYQLQQSLEQETWILCPVPLSLQSQVQEHFFKQPQSLEMQSSDKKQDALFLKSGSFHVVSSALFLVSMLNEYIDANRRFPEFVTDVGRQSIELISLFNSRSCQLILGAQAMRVSSLKSITAKHLALCSQSILLIMHLLQPLTEALLSECPASKRTILQPEFDRLTNDLATHLEGIHSKLVGIMEERLQTGIQEIRNLFKSARNSPESEEIIQPSQAAQLIGKQLRILTQVLTPLLHEKQLEDIFIRVIKSFVHVLEGLFGDICIELNLMNPDTKEISRSKTPTTPHPLDERNSGQSLENNNSVSYQRQLASADCSFLYEILSKLPAGVDTKKVLEPFSKIVVLLVPHPSSL